RRVAGKKRTHRLENGRIVERPGIERAPVALPHLAAVDEAAARRAGVAHGFAPVGVFQGVHEHRTGDLHRPAGHDHERDEARAGRLAAVGAEAIPHEHRLTPRLVAHRPAQTPTGPGRVAHGPAIVASPTHGKLALPDGTPGDGSTATTSPPSWAAARRTTCAATRRLSTRRGDCDAVPSPRNRTRP